LLDTSNTGVFLLWWQVGDRTGILKEVPVKKNIWQVQQQTVCKVIGMALDYKDLKKIALKFGISSQDPLIDHEFALHSTAVHVCSSQSSISRHIQKIIETKYRPYSKRLAAMEPAELISAVRGDQRIQGIPLWAILWQLATLGLENGASVETAVFGYIHMLEHKLVKAHWDRPAECPKTTGATSALRQENRTLKQRLLELQRDFRKSVKACEKLRVQLAKAMTFQADSRSVQSQVAETRYRESSARYLDKIQRLNDLLQAARSDKEGLLNENEQLRTELVAISRGARDDPENRAARLQAPCDKACPLREYPRGKRVAMVGGIGSLEVHYREFIETMGGNFHRHDGDCRGGACVVEECVRGADLVVCPVTVNSHNAVKTVKKVCKATGVACCFPRSAGVNGLRRALEELSTGEQAA